MGAWGVEGTRPRAGPRGHLLLLSRRAPTYALSQGKLTADVPRLLCVTDVGLSDCFFMESSCFSQLQFRANQGKSRRGTERGIKAVTQAALGSMHWIKIGQ